MKRNQLTLFFIYKILDIVQKDAQKKLSKTEAKKFLDNLERMLVRNVDRIDHEITTVSNIKNENFVTKKKGKLDWLAMSWRPVMMYLFMYIIFQFYVIIPFLNFFYPAIMFSPLPSEMWTLLTTAVGGYILSRGAEKGIQQWRGNTNQVVVQSQPLGEEMDENSDEPCDVEPEEEGKVDSPDDDSDEEEKNI